jgi:ABC-2 type transport system permease protein
VKSWTIFLLGGIYLSLVLGDIVAKETEEGSFRLLMSRPISRLRLLILKYLAGVIYTTALVTFVALSALLVGWIQRGSGGQLLVWNPEFGIFVTWSALAGLWRMLVNLPFLILSCLTVSSLAFMFSCFRMKPATAAILAVSVVTVDTILSRLPMAHAYEKLALITRMGSHFHLFEPSIPWSTVVRDYSYLAGIDVTAFIIGWTAFQIRDFKS